MSMKELELALNNGAWSCELAIALLKYLDTKNESISSTSFDKVIVNTALSQLPITIAELERVKASCESLRNQLTVSIHSTKYRRRPEVIEAVLYTGFNQKQIKEFCGSKIKETPDCLTLYTSDNEELEVSIGEYIVKDSNCEFDLHDSSVFIKHYEEDN